MAQARQTMHLSAFASAARLSLGPPSGGFDRRPLSDTIRRGPALWANGGQSNAQLFAAGQTSISGLLQRVGIYEQDPASSFDRCVSDRARTLYDESRRRHCDHGATGIVEPGALEL